MYIVSPFSYFFVASYQGNIILNPLETSDEDDDDSDWDSEPVREALRVQPSIRKSSSSAKKPSSFGSPYYSEEIGPQLDFGFQWPQLRKGFTQVQESRHRQHRPSSKRGQKVYAL
jgi:hypothetical protein